MRSGFSTIKEAREAYAEIINNFGKKHILQIAQCCMKNFYTILPYYKGRVKERTYNNRLSMIKILLPIF